MSQAAIDLAIATAPRPARAALTALFALDTRLGTILRSTGEPLIGQMRLTWWREALTALDTTPAPAEPTLADVARRVLPHGVTGAVLAGMTEGWEMLLTADDLDRYADARGGGLFAAAATILGGAPPPGAGEGWALADLAGNLSDPDRARAARMLARGRLQAAFAAPVAHAIRPLGVLALLAAFDLRGVRPARDAISLVGFRLTGRHRLEIADTDDSLAS